jgi:circadian clock protein KaiB
MTEITEELQKLLSNSEKGQYVLRLYVSGSTLQSSRAIANIKAICETRLKGRYELDVVDLYQQPELANGQQIVVAPTLVRLLPLPFRRLVGDLSNRPLVLLALKLKPDAG